MTADLAFASLREHRRLLRRGSLSARELAESCLRRIERIDGGLGAFEAVAAALRQADSAQAALMGADDTRPLLGVPVAVKADFDIAGQVTTHGSAANRRPAQRSAAAVRLLEAAGAVVIGTTRMAELARWPFTESARLGPTRNPWDRNLSAGGSSGGSAAAVAAGLVPAALGTDGAGSIRIPPACCGVFGLKPHRDRITAEPPAGGWRVIWGADDRLWPIDSADGYRGLDDVQILRLEGVGHSPMLEAPKKTAELIEAFVTPANGRHDSGTATPRATGAAG